jgi:hypothetical protein
VERTTTTRQDEPAPERHHPEKHAGDIRKHGNAHPLFPANVEGLPELRHKRKDHINNLELKFNKMLQEIQHPIHSYIVNSETDLTQTS